MTVLSIPLPIFILLFLPLLFPAFRAVSVRKGRVPFFEVLPVMFFCVLILLALLFHGECGLCRSIPVDGLWLTLSMSGSFLCYLPALPKEERRSPAPMLLPALVTLSSVVFLQSAPDHIIFGGGILIGVLCLASFLIGGAYPGAYLRFFPVRLGVSAILSGLLSLSRTHLSSGILLLGLLAAVLLILPAPFPRRSEKVIQPGFLRVDQAIFSVLPPLIAFHLFRGVVPELIPPIWMLLSLALLLSLSGLLFAKTSLFVEELADGLTVAGTGFMISGLLTFQMEGHQGALFLAIMIPLATALSGLSLSFLAQRFRTRTFQGLVGQGTVVEPLRLAFLFGAFQGMSLPLVGGMLGEWLILKALSTVSLTLSLLAIGGIFLAFVLVLGRTRILFTGEAVSRLSNADQRLACEIGFPEAWALGLAFFFLMMIDLFGSFGWMGGR